MHNKTQIIAEFASNYGGNLKLAKEMIGIAASIGVDYVKVQSWQTRTLKNKSDPQYDWFTRAELSDEAHFELMQECRSRGVKFLTTCFDVARIPFIAELGMKEVKVGSSDLASTAMITGLKKRFEHIIVSTGMSFGEEILKTSRLLSGTKFTFLHCVATYPTAPGQVNMARMDYLRQFTASVGYSDHSVGIEAARLAIARGATIVEKHFSLGEQAGCRFSPWDATPQEMEKLVKYAEECDLLMGSGTVDPGEEELKSRERFLGRWGDNK